MLNIVSALFAYFRAKPMSHFIMAFIFLALGAAFYITAMQTDRDKAAALAGPMPAAVSLNAFGDDDIHLADEVNVIGQINPAYNYELTEQRSGADTVRFMYVLFGPDDAADTKVARAAIILTAAQLDAFDAQVAANVIDLTALGPVFSVNGEATSMPDLKKLANDAMAKEGLTKSPDFIFIDPWLEGRAAALAPSDLDATVISGVIASPALLSVLLALFGMRRGRRQSAAAAHMAAAPIPAALMGHAVPATQPAASAPIAPVAALSAALRAPMSRGKKIRIGLVAGLVLVVVTKQFWVFALIPLVAIFAMNRDMRKIGKMTYDMIMAIIDKTATPESPVAQPAPAPAITPQTPVMPAMAAAPAPKPTAKPLPPAIRPGFSFRDLLPKRREPEPQENPYAALSASVRDERLRRGGM